MATTSSAPPLSNPRVRARLSFTVPQGQNPVVTRDRVFENLSIADAGTETTVVTTFTGTNNNLLGELGSILGSYSLPGSQTPAARSNGINLKPLSFAR